MGKKDRMLAHITNNVNWFMTTSTSVEVIPYYDLSTSVFNRVKQYIASDAQYSDVVCLISTSVLDIGKSGILFTTDYVYSKAWGGIFTGNYKNWIFSSIIAEFDVINEFDTDRMRELMSDLADIAIEEDEKEQREQEFEEVLKNIEDFGKIVGAVTLGGMAIVDLFTTISDVLVSKNNEQILDEIAQLEESTDPQVVSVMEIYSSFFPLINSFAEVLSENGNSEEIDEESIFDYICSLNDILLELYSQVNNYLDISPDDENFEKFIQWLEFWALMFYDSDDFKNTYKISALDDMPEIWDAIAEIMDSILKDEVWDKSFSDILFDFGDTVTDNLVNVLELMENSDWNEDFEESMAEILESNDRAVHALENALDRATDYLFSLLPDNNEA